jgi:hypothetical protein
VVAVVASFSAARLTDIPKPTSAVTCIGLPLTAQLQVVPNTNYCGGTANEQIRLADGDTWTNGEVTGSGISTGQQHGALECSGNCTLVNVNVHDVANAWAAFYAPGANLPRVITIVGGRFANAGSEGVGLSGSTATVTGTEIDHNGATANCGFEGGGSKWVGNATFTQVNVHDNLCPGLWSDGGGSGTINNSTLTNNGISGAFIEISNNVHVFGNTVTGNGFHDANAGGCSNWYWDAGIGISTSSNVEIDHNLVTGNCNGITAIEQNRALDGVTILTRNDNIHDNQVGLARGKVGLVAPNGDLGVYSGNNRFVNNQYAMPNCDVAAFGWQNATYAFAAWQAIPQDAGATCGQVAPQTPTPSAPLPTSSPTATPSPALLPSFGETITLANGQTCTIRVIGGVVSGSCY